MPTNTFNDFTDLSRADLEAMLEAGQWVLECHRILQKTADNIVGEVLRDNGTFTELDHYPPGDVFDSSSHSQYYYHAHRDNEHGHFHTFLRGDGAGAYKPIDQTHMGYMDDREDTICHLIAISMDSAGLPVGLFTTNRWVTAENWFTDAETAAMVSSFDMDLAQPSWPVNIWITNMLRLFRPQIIELIQQRKAIIDDWQLSHVGEDVYEDRKIDILSEIPISIERQITLSQQALTLCE